MVALELLRKIYLLASLLVDRKATVSERDDAAIELGEIEENISIVEEILRDFLSNFPNEDDTLIASCGESLGYIWIRNNKFDVEFYRTLPYYAKSEIEGLIKNLKPEWSSFLD
jgi:hypothetical protein